MPANPNQETWEPPRELQRSLPRPVRLTPAGVMLTSFGALFFIAALAIGYATDSQSRAYARVEQEGVKTDARITRLWIGGGKSRTPMVSYRFTVESATIAGKSQLREAVWNALHVGDPMPVRYVPWALELNHPAQGAPAPPPAWLVFSVILWPTIFLWAATWHQWRLLSEGEPAPGIITELRRTKRLRVRYDFTLPSGQLGHGKTSVDRRRTLAVGAKVCVLYNRHNPRRSTLYPLDYVRIRPE